MSGGVDSSVSAALLKRAGFNVVGVFLKFWAGPSAGSIERWNRCCSSDAENRARAVAVRLGIPFYIFNFSKEFKKRIVDHFLQEYRAGRTPNPCVVCNKEIKFGLLMERALALNAELVATGHYVRWQKGKLLMGRDKDKDQSYFLWQLSSRQLKHVLFPVGQYKKSEVKRLAKELKLPAFEAPESQEVCFIQDTTSEFLSRYIKQKPGKIVDVNGKVLGHHQGLFFYTIGQRKGIGLPGGPYWVVKKDLKKNVLVVSRNEKDLLQKELRFKKTNWLSSHRPKLPLKVKARIRYRAKSASATIYRDNRIVFNRPQRAVTPGQSVAFYQGEQLLGGGIIN